MPTSRFDPAINALEALRDNPISNDLATTRGILTVCLVSMKEAAQGWERYEALRKLNLIQFGELYARNLAGGNFDGLVDELMER